MSTLCAMGLLEKQDGRFSNTPSVSRVLAKDKPNYLAGLMRIVHLWEIWSTPAAAVRQGRSVVDRAESVNKRGAEWLRAFIAATRSRACQHVLGVVGLLACRASPTSWTWRAATPPTPWRSCRPETISAPLPSTCPM